MSKSRTKNWVVKRNVLNEMRANNMKLQELRLFGVYLSKINPKDEGTRTVSFAVSEFMEIMELKQPNIKHLESIAKNLLNKPIFIPAESGGFTAFNLFRLFRVATDGKGGWCIEITADEEALPYLFDYRGEFFKYKLWNTLRLKSKNQLRMYEILKQYEKIGYRVISIQELKDWLGIEKDEYPEYKTFRRDVLEVCRKALIENTDISFTFEAHDRKDRGGKINTLKFTISENKSYKDPINLEKFIDLSSRNMIEGEYIEKTKTTKTNLTKITEATSQSEYDANFTEDQHLTNFETFWQAYPEHKRAGKKSAMLIWLDLPHTQESFAEIMSGLEAAKKSNKWTTNNGIYIHEPTNWIRDERWKDNHKDTTSTKNKNKKINKAQNYENRKWDYEELAKMEREFLDKKLAQGG